MKDKIMGPGQDMVIETKNSLVFIDATDTSLCVDLSQISAVYKDTSAENSFALGVAMGGKLLSLQMKNMEDLRQKEDKLLALWFEFKGDDLSHAARV